MLWVGPPRQQQYWKVLAAAECLRHSRAVIRAAAAAGTATALVRAATAAAAAATAIGAGADASVGARSPIDPVEAMAATAAAGANGVIAALRWRRSPAPQRVRWARHRLYERSILSEPQRVRGAAPGAPGQQGSCRTAIWAWRGVGVGVGVAGRHGCRTTGVGGNVVLPGVAILRSKGEKGPQAPHRLGAGYS